MKKIKNETNTLILHFIWMSFAVSITYLWSQTAVFVFPIWLLIFPILFFILIVRSNIESTENKDKKDLKNL